MTTEIASKMSDYINLITILAKNRILGEGWGGWGGGGHLFENVFMKVYLWQT